MHEIVKDELQTAGSSSWERTMCESFLKMDKEVGDCCNGGGTAFISACRCELQTPQCDAVGSTAVVSVVTPDKIVVSNCGDSRAVLCRKGVAIPLSVDHKVRFPFQTLDHKSSSPNPKFIFRKLNCLLILTVILRLQPDRPDELNRIQDAGGRVIFWDGPRVLGVLAMSRAIGKFKSP